MDKVANLVRKVRSTIQASAPTAVGIGGGVYSAVQIQRNKRSASSSKGWVTRRTNLRDL